MANLLKVYLWRLSTVLNEIKLLTKVQMCNFFGLNESKYSRDGSKKKKMYTAVIGVLVFGILICTQIGGSAFLLIDFGLTNIIPSMIATTVSGISLTLTLFRAGPTMFNLQSYEKTICMPIRVESIVISRFLNLYLYNMFFNVAAVGSVIAVCLVNSNLSVYFYITMLLGLFILPLIPITIAVFLGSIGYYLASKVKKKNVLSIIWQVGLIIAVVYLTSSTTEVSAEDMAAQLTAQMSSAESYFPFLKWFSDGVNGNILLFLLFVLISVIVSAGIFAVISKFYKKICVGLTANSAKRNYKMTEQQSKSVFMTLYQREIKRYFSSAIYVTNTILSFVFALAFGIAIPFLGIETICAEIGLSYGVVSRICPIVIGAMCNIMPTTTAAISIEGKNFWLLKSLPITMKQIATAKIMVNLTFAFPATVIASTCISIAFKANVIDAILNLLIPLSIVIFGSIMGLFINIMNPMMDWESEVVPVKQSKASLLTMFTLFLSAFAAIIIFFIAPNNAIILVRIAVVIIFLVCSILIFNMIAKKDIKQIK